MSNQLTPLSSTDIAKGLEVVELEQRLEMVHLTAVEAEASSRCDGNDVDIQVDVELSAIDR
ncbi:hypothetical protein [Neolewinella agarilytica]|uniref:Uncharacterized protein n=1 Tax=Neolewinella agarilytica TaxID=478744 RepID=A0A1H9AK04_9BACT|nr:hypothetical protein [Neolewinella agarilytica]SEP76989.1 hypothetical protein SAMN05444359_102127 [Neolewinella agarilytica]